MKDIVYFDLETQKSADEVGGWHRIIDMKMSVGVLYSTARQAYKIYDERHVEDLIRDLQQADLVVGFNHLRFDYEVLHAYTVYDLRQLPSLDILVDLQATLPFRPSLDSVAGATLGVEKTAEGTQALRWFKQGRILEIAEYCCFDVKITKLIYEFGAAHQHVSVRSTKTGQLIKIPVKWSL
jgi:DEAD/DEAH box helicase domain-containing protein